MHNWYHSTSQTFYIYTDTDYNVQLYMAHSSCFYLPLLTPLCLPLAPLSTPFYLLGTLLAVTESVHLGLRLLVNWPPLFQPFPQTLPPPNSQNPNYPAPHKDNLRKNPASSVRNNYPPFYLISHSVQYSFLWHVHTFFQENKSSWCSTTCNDPCSHLYNSITSQTNNHIHCSKDTTLWLFRTEDAGFFLRSS